MCIQMAQQERWKTAELHLGRIQTGVEPREDSPTPHYGSETSEGVRLKPTLCITEASTTEEPDAGKPHVRDCVGGVG